MLLISFYAPENTVEIIKNAMFSAGAGRIGNYDQCAWQTKGTGQFRALANSHPHVGSQHQLETVPEIKVEMVCETNCIEAVISALRSHHPYEEPAYHVLRAEDF